MGSQCIVGEGTYIDFDIDIGNNVNNQDCSLLYHGATVEDRSFGVFSAGKPHKGAGGDVGRPLWHMPRHRHFLRNDSATHT
jgi:hypothetical protein